MEISVMIEEAERICVEISRDIILATQSKVSEDERKEFYECAKAVAVNLAHASKRIDEESQRGELIKGLISFNKRISECLSHLQSSLDYLELRTGNITSH